MKNNILKNQKKRNLFLSILFSLTTFLLLISFYFLILISVEPKSFPIITSKVNTFLNSNLSYGNRLKIKKVSIKLENFSKLNIILENLSLIADDKAIFASKAVLQFSLFNVIKNQKPAKISLEGVILEIKHSNVNLKAPRKLFEIEDNYDKQIKDYIIKFWHIFAFIDNGNILTKTFEIKNSKIKLIDFNNLERELLIRESIIQITNNKKDLIITSKNSINLNNNKLDVSLNANCQFRKNKYLKCDAGFFNLVPDSFSGIFKKDNFLSKINTNLGLNFNFEIDSDHNINSILFNVNSNKGDFYFKKLFAEKINFKNLLIVGEISKSLTDIEITSLKADLDEDIKFYMSAKIKNFNKKHEQIDTNIKISNSSGDKIKKFWPIFLAPKVRDWVTSSISGGIIRDSYVNFRLKKKSNNNRFLDFINSKVFFSKIKLEYSKKMPFIYNIDGTASFSKKKMLIDLTSASVLNSRINTAKITINNLSAKESKLLKINGSSYGKLSDAFKHITSKQSFLDSAASYIRGKADTVFNIQLPIKNNLSLKDFYIKIISKIDNIDTVYLGNNSSVDVNVTKEFSNNEFVIFSDFLNSKINYPLLNISKDKNIPSKAEIKIKLKDNNDLRFNKIDLTIDKLKIKSNALYSLKHNKLLKLFLQNNYSDNYNLLYEFNLENLLSNLELRGQYIDLRPIIRNFYDVSSPNLGSGSNNNFSILFNLDKVDLMSGQFINNLKIKTKCLQAICYDGFIQGKMGNNNIIDIDLLNKYQNNNYLNIDGKISNISPLARGLNISNQIMSGRAIIKARMYIEDEKIVLRKGNLFIDNKFSVIKNDIFYEITKNKTFEKLKSRIDSSDKITFDEVKVDFSFEDKIITVKKMIANNYMIGFTAKGQVDLNNYQVNFSGLVIPGYSLNKLFGIGDIPVVGAILMGESGGGIFAAKYKYSKRGDQKRGDFKINKISAIVPGSVRNIFDLFD